MTATDAASRLSAARTRLILDKPFLGALVMRLPMIAASPRWCRTTATDARAFYYNAAWIESLSLPEVEFMVAHEALHCALSHFARRRHRVRRRWDVACDLAINPLLAEDGLQPPAGSLMIAEFAGMTAEEIYPLLDDHPECDEPLDEHLYDGPDGGSGGAAEGAGQRPRQTRQGEAPRPAPLGEPQRQALEERWRQYVASAAQAAMAAGKLSGAMGRLARQLSKPHLDWRMLLAHHLSQTAREDHTWMRPSRREGAAILPSLHSHEADLLVALDVSGSVGDSELREFLAEVNAIKGQLHARVTLLACDAALAPGAPWVFEPWEELRLPERIAGGGGTDLRPPFGWAERQDRQPAVLVYFTDGRGPFPAQPPGYPVLWLVKGPAPVPWGRRIQLN